MSKKLIPWDSSKYLGSEEDIAAYLKACSETNDPTTIVLALGNIARARNMSALARQIGMTREGLYKALSPAGNPSFTTVSKVASALGYPLTFTVARPQLRTKARKVTLHPALVADPAAIENSIRTLALLDATVAKASELRESLLRLTNSASVIARAERSPASTKTTRQRREASARKGARAGALSHD